MFAALRHAMCNVLGRSAVATHTHTLLTDLNTEHTHSALKEHVIGCRLLVGVWMMDTDFRYTRNSTHVVRNMCADHAVLTHVCSAAGSSARDVPAAE